MLDRFRSPVFIASALSLGAHGVFFAAAPMLSASEDLQEQEESVPVVALSAEESQRLPGAIKNSDNNSFFGNAPLITQEGDALLPVPGLPPYGDLTGLDSGFSEPLQTSPLWGNPVDIFQGSLPAIPAETSLVFPKTNDFDSSNSQPFGIELDQGSSFTIEQPSPTEPEEDIAPEPEDIASEDSPLIAGSEDEDVPGPALEAPLTAPEGGTTVAGAFEADQGTSAADLAAPPPQEVNSDNLAAVIPGDNETAPDENEIEPTQPSLGSNDPALIALKAEQERLRVGYRNNGQGASNAGIAGTVFGQFISDNNIEAPLPWPSESRTVQYPDSLFKCPADALSATFAVAKRADGTAVVSEQIQSSQYPALDTVAQEEAAAFAASLEEPGAYNLSIEFSDQAGKCSPPADTAV